MGLGSDIVEAVARIRSGDFKTGWKFFNQIRTKRTLAKVELESARVALAEQLIALEERQRQAKLSQAQTEAAKEDIRLGVELKLALHSLEVLEIESSKKLTSQAADKGLTVESHQKLKVAGSESDIKINEEGKLSDIRTKEKDKDAERDINKTKELNEHEHRLELEKMQEQVRLAIIVDKLGEHQMIELILEQMERLHTRMSAIRHYIQIDDEARVQLLNDYDEYLLTLRKDRRSREVRLVQADQTKRLPEGQQTTNLRRDYRKALKTGEE